MKKIVFVSNLLLILLLSSFFAFFVASEVYNRQWKSKLSEIDEFLNTKRFNIVNESDNQDSLKETMVYNLSNQIVSIIKKKDSKANILDSIYDKQDLIASAVVISNDGWIATNADIPSRFLSETGLKSLSVVDREKNIIQIKQVVIDSLLDIKYFKIDKDSLNPIAIANSYDLRSGEIIYGIKSSLYSREQEVLSSSVRSLNSYFIQNKNDLVRKISDIRYISLNNIIQDGLVVVNNRFQLVGFSVNFNNQSYLLPSAYFRYSLKKLFTGTNEIVYPSLDLNYINLSDLVLNDDYPQQGAYVYNVLNKHSLFKRGDIILKIEDDEINSFQDLNQILLDYKVNTKLKVYLIRNNKKESIEVVLRPLKF